MHGGARRVVLGSHDTDLIARIEDAIGGRDAFEIAMLYGIRTDEQRRLVRKGYEVRTLISYGPSWYPWFMRRIAEKPVENTLLALRNSSKPATRPRRLPAMMRRLRGAIAASVTPMRDGGRAVDVDAIERLTRFLADGGVDGVLSCGTTGEGLLLDVAERRAVTEAFLVNAPTDSRSPFTPGPRPRETRSHSPPTPRRSAPRRSP